MLIFFQRITNLDIWKQFPEKKIYVQIFFLNSSTDWSSFPFQRDKLCKLYPKDPTCKNKFGLLVPGNYSNSTLYHEYDEKNDTNSSKNVGSLNVDMTTNHLKKNNMTTTSIDFKSNFTSYKIKNNIVTSASNTTSKYKSRNWRHGWTVKKGFKLRLKA